MLKCPRQKEQKRCHRQYRLSLIERLFGHDDGLEDEVESDVEGTELLPLESNEVVVGDECIE